VKLLLALLLLATPARAEGTRAEVRLIVLGDFPPALVDAVAEGLTRELQVRVTRMDPRPLPKSAWYPPRARYRADRLIRFLAEQVPEKDVRVLGLTTVDISTTKGAYADWGVFGLGDLGGPAAVISSFRLRRKARDDAQIRFRVVSTAVHEVGHTLGLEHCREARCVMQDAEGSIANTDSGTGGLGPECRAKLDATVPAR
jgi:archaemetzincin